MANCVKCGGSMEDGFVVDVGYGKVEVSKWQRGQPEKSFWTGVKKGDRYNIRSMRCRRCGFLEQYAG